jgi:hypothetical protein
LSLSPHWWQALPLRRLKRTSRLTAAVAPYTVATCVCRLCILLFLSPLSKVLTHLPPVTDIASCRKLRLEGLGTHVENLKRCQDHVPHECYLDDCRSTEVLPVAPLKPKHPSSISERANYRDNETPKQARVSRFSDRSLKHVGISTSKIPALARCQDRFAAVYIYTTDTMPTAVCGSTQRDLSTVSALQYVSSVMLPRTALL